MILLLSLGQIARILKIQPYKIAYNHSTAAIPEPNRFCGKRAYTLEDLQRIADHFGIKIDPHAMGEINV